MKRSLRASRQDGREAPSKILPLDELARVCARHRAKGDVLVHCHGVFDLLHPGHIRHLQAARRRGDVLIVTVTHDRDVTKGPGRPVFGEQLRAESVASLECVDYVGINRSPTAVDVIRKLRPHLYAKGQDYRDKRRDLTGAIRDEERAAKSVGARLWITGEPMMSSSSLLNRHFQVYPPGTRAYLDAFSRRCGSEELIGSVKALRNIRALVVGEAIIDEYCYCQAMGKSPKEAIVSTRYLDQETFAGGSLAAANHIAGFLSRAWLATCLGETNPRDGFIRSHLKPNVRAHFVRRKGVSTIIKRRFVEPAFLTKMFEMSYLDDRPLEPAAEDALASLLERELPRFDLVIVTDYGHGMMTPRLVRILCRKAPFLAINTQTNSANIGFNVITKYRRADYVCIDEPELRLAARDRTAPLESLMRDLGRRLSVPRLIVTRGHLGALAYARGEGFSSIPVFSRQVVDRTGAGDAFLSLSALCAAGGLPIESCAFVGNAAGALHVGTVCNRTPIEPPALFKFIATMLK